MVVKTKPTNVATTLRLLHENGGRCSMAILRRDSSVNKVSHAIGLSNGHVSVNNREFFSGRRHMGR